MKTLGSTSQTTMIRLQQEARAAYERRDLEQAVGILRQANRHAPTDASVLLQLGRMQGLLCDYPAAERSFERAVKFAATHRKTEVLTLAGLQARDFYQPQIAERFFRRAVAQRDATPDMLVAVAGFRERRHQVDDAAELVDRALRSQPQHPGALLARAHLARRAGRFDEAAAGLRPILDSSGHREVRARAGYELGAVLDSQGRYDEAMTAVMNAKSLLAAEAAPHFTALRKLREHQARMRDDLSPASFQRWSETAADLHPPRRLAWLGGHPRSGTTLLEQVLDSHPDILSAEETNNFYDAAYRILQNRLPNGTPALDVLNTAPVELLQHARADYFRAMDLCLGTAVGPRLLVDKNPALTVTIPCLVRLFPEMKLLMVRRDPRDVVLSCFMQPFVPVRQVSSAWLRLETTVAEYVAVMGLWRKVAPMLPNPCLEVAYEDMVADLEPVARKTMAFLGVPWDDRVLAFDEHATQKPARSPSYVEVTRKVFPRAQGRWRNYRKYLEPHWRNLEPFVRAFGYETCGTAFETK